MSVELTTNSTITHTQIYSVSHMAAFPYLEALDSTSALHLGAILNIKIANKSTEICKTRH